MVTYLEQKYVKIHKPLDWQRRGLMQTSTGYGSKLTSEWCIRIAGENRLRRVYVVCYSNCGSAYVLIKGIAHYLRGE